MQNIYLQADDKAFNGPSTGQVKDAIELVSFSHGVSMPLSSSSVSNTGRTHGRSHHQDLVITKFLCKASPNLAQYCCAGHNAGKFTVRMFQGDQNAKDYKPIEYLQIVLENVIISSYSTSGGGGDRPIETVALNYSKITWIYNPQKKDSPGQAKGNIPGGWDRSENKPYTAGATK